MQPEDRNRLEHMRDAAQIAMDFLRYRDRVALDEDRMLLFAMIRAIEIVGEAAARVSVATKDRYPDIPWRAASAMRNRLIHGYFDVDTEIVWVTVIEELPRLVEQLDNALEDA